MGPLRQQKSENEVEVANSTIFGLPTHIDAYRAHQGVGRARVLHLLSFEETAHTHTASQPTNKQAGNLKKANRQTSQGSLPASRGRGWSEVLKSGKSYSSLRLFKLIFTSPSLSHPFDTFLKMPRSGRATRLIELKDVGHNRVECGV